MRNVALLLLPVGPAAALHYHAARAEEGIIISRRMIAAESGVDSSFAIYPDCNFSQTVGQTDVCVLPWKSEMAISGKMSLPGGFATTDQFQVDFDLSGDAKQPSVKKYFGLSPLVGSVRCGMCSGQCNVHAKGGGGFMFKMMSPAVMSALISCGDVKKESAVGYEIPMKGFNLPEGPTGDLGLRVATKVNIGFFTADNTPRLQEELVFNVVPPIETSSFAEPDVAANPWATSAVATRVRGLSAMYRALNPYTLFKPNNSAEEEYGLFGVAWLLAQAGISQYFESPAAGVMSLAERRRSESGWVNAIAMRGTLLSSESPKNRVLFKMGEQDCQMGTICKVEVDAPITVEFRMVVDQEIQEGDFITVNSKPSVGGPAGATIGRYIKLPTMKLPLCGATDKDVKITIPIIQKSFSYRPFPCGRYAMAVNMPSFQMTIPDFTDVRLSDMGIPRIPSVPDVVGQMPSMVVENHFTARHKDGTMIADFVLEGGISQVKTKDGKEEEEDA